MSSRLPTRRRKRDAVERPHRINIRFSDAEYKSIGRAARRAELTRAGFCAEFSLAAAAGPNASLDVNRKVLASLRTDFVLIRTALNRVRSALKNDTISSAEFDAVLSEVIDATALLKRQLS